MLWARMARASRAVVARERAWPPNSCYRITDSALENCLSTGCPVGQRKDMSKGKQLREGLTGACWWYAIGDHKVPHSGWMGRLPGSNPWARLAIRCQLLVSRITGCAVTGAGPQRGYTRPGTGSLHPVAIRAAVEATRPLKPLVQRVAKATWRACRP